MPLYLIRSLRLSAILLILSVSANLSGQFKFSEGYIITNENDTLHGEIDSKTSRSLAEKCIFRQTPGSDNVVYYPGDIRGFHIINYKYFVSREIPYQESTSLVFLEYLVDGVVDLYCDYSYEEPSYFLESDSVLYRLTNEETTFTRDKKIYSKPSEKYKGTMRYIFQDEPATIKRTNSAAFSHNSLIRVTEDYHNRTCDDYSCITYKKSMKTGFAIEPLYGYSYSWMGLRYSEDRNTGGSHVLGLKFRLEPANIDNSWSINLGMYASAEYFEGEYTFDQALWIDVAETTGNKYLLQYVYGMLRIPFIIEYSLTNHRIQPFLALGYDNIFIIYPIYHRSLISTFAGEETVGSPRTLNIQQRYQIGLLAETGLKCRLGKRSYLKLAGSYEYRFFTSYMEKVHSTRIDLSYGTYITHK